MDLREELKKTQAMLDKQLHVMQPSGVTLKDAMRKAMEGHSWKS